MSKKQEETVIAVNKDKTYGIAMSEDKLCVTVYQRKQYTEDTEVPMKFNKAVNYKFYAAGEYGPWQLAPKPYQVNIDRALVWIYDMMVMDKIDGAEDVRCLSTIVESERKTFVEQLPEILSNLKTSGSVSSLEETKPISGSDSMD